MSPLPCPGHSMSPGCPQRSARGTGHDPALRLQALLPAGLCLSQVAQTAESFRVRGYSHMESIFPLSGSEQSGLAQ